MMEVVRRRGRWLFGEFLEWLSEDVTEENTYEFCRRFFKVSRVVPCCVFGLVVRLAPLLTPAHRFCRRASSLTRCTP